MRTRVPFLYLSVENPMFLWPSGPLATRICTLLLKDATLSQDISPLRYLTIRELKTRVEEADYES
jgi:hypothetical protein